MIRVGFYSILVNLGLTGAKFTLAVVTGSLALRADAIHSMVDVFGSIALILGLTIASRTSREFPYGLHKVENLATVVISALIFYTAYEILVEAITGTDEAADFPLWVLVPVASFILVPFLFGRYELNKGRQFNSPSLIADGSQFRADVLSSTIVFLTVLGQRYNLPLDRIGAGIIAVLIAYAAWGLLAGSMRVLLDASIDRATLQRIRSIIESEPAVRVKEVTGRSSGRYKFVEATVEMSVMNLQKAHELSEQLEIKIRDSVQNVDRVLIHYEPAQQPRLRYAVPLVDDSGTISEHFGESRLFALVDVDRNENKVVAESFVENPFYGEEKGKGIKTARLLLDYKPDIVLTREKLAGKGPGYVFAEAGTRTAETASKSLHDLKQDLAGVSG